MSYEIHALAKVFYNKRRKKEGDWKDPCFTIKGLDADGNEVTTWCSVEAGKFLFENGICKKAKTKDGSKEYIKVLRDDIALFVDWETVDFLGGTKPSGTNPAKQNTSEALPEGRSQIEGLHLWALRASRDAYESVFPEIETPLLLEAVQKSAVTMYIDAKQAGLSAPGGGSEQIPLGEEDHSDEPEDDLPF
jgi:hypothetical protein